MAYKFNSKRRQKQFVSCEGCLCSSTYICKQQSFGSDPDRTRQGRKIDSVFLCWINEFVLFLLHNMIFLISTPSHLDDSRSSQLLTHNEPEDSVGRSCELWCMCMYGVNSYGNSHGFLHRLQSSPWQRKIVFNAIIQVLDELQQRKTEKKEQMWNNNSWIFIEFAFVLIGRTSDLSTILFLLLLKI